MSSDRNEAALRRHRLQEELRSVSFGSIMRGTIVERLRRCGRPNCRCATDPSARHGGKFLTVSLNGRTQAIHVRPEDEKEIREAIAAYGKLWKIINELTSCEMADLKRRARDRRRARLKRRRA